MQLRQANPKQGSLESNLLFLVNAKSSKDHPNRGSLKLELSPLTTPPSQQELWNWLEGKSTAQRLGGDIRD
jgi:hypothetical protein